MLEKSSKAVGLYGAEITGSCELPDMGTELRSSAGTVLKHLHSPSSKPYLLRGPVPALGFRDSAFAFW